jgi:hypothetical protein
VSCSPMLIWIADVGFASVMATGLLCVVSAMAVMECVRSFVRSFVRSQSETLQ